MAYVARVMGTDVFGLEDAALGELHLACGCSRGDKDALARFDVDYMSAVGPALAHMKLPQGTADEVRQRVRHKLLVPTDVGGYPKIDAYAGRGKLRGLVKVVATRTALNLIRASKREVGLSDGGGGLDLSRLPSPERDPELHYMKQQYRQHFSEAFEAAVGDLDGRQRNLLRLHLLEGITLDRLATMYDVHRATVVRWLAKARSTLMEATHKRLQARLSVNPEELESLMRLIASRLDVSVQRMLQTRDADHD